MRTEYIREQVPAIYTQLIAPPSLDQQYWGYIAECEAIVKQCNVDKESIRQWSDNAPKNP